MKTQFSYFLAFDTTGPSNSYSCRMESCRISIPCKAVQQSSLTNLGIVQERMGAHLSQLGHVVPHLPDL